MRWSHPIGRLFTKAEIVRVQIKLSQLRPDLAYLLGPAGEWVDNSDLHATDEFQPNDEHQYTTLARVLIAQSKADQALPLLKRLCQAAESTSRLGDLIEYLVLQSLALQAQRQHDQAFSSLNKALILGQPEGYIRAFVDEGKPMDQLLEHADAERQGISPAYINRIRATFGEVILASGDTQPELQIVSRQSVAVNLVEPLSRRELDVLRLIIAGLKNQEIAEELVVSLNTVRLSHKEYL